MVVAAGHRRTAVGDDIHPCVVVAVGVGTACVVTGTAVGVAAVPSTFLRNRFFFKAQKRLRTVHKIHTYTSSLRQATKTKQ
eukprot:3600012-Ditylum_brightwellii.AAC.1